MSRTRVEYDPKDMIFRRLGSTGLQVSIISLGGWLTYGGTVKGDPVKEIIQTAFENGINYFDTAEVYSQGKSELEMGRVFKELGIRRSDFVFSTKIFGGGHGGKGPNDTGLSKKHIIEGTNDSLKRLQMDYVDILFAHRPDPNVPMKEVVDGFSWLVNQGKALYWGTSEWSADQIQEAIDIADKHGWHAPVVEQPLYNALEQDRLSKDLVPIFEKYGYGTTVYSPLAASLLTGKYNSGAIPETSRYATTAHHPYVQQLIAKLGSDEGKEQIRKLQGFEKYKNEKFGADVTLAQLALAWTATNPRVSTMIIGASSPEQVLENLKFLKLIDRLDKKTYEEISAIFAENTS